MNPDLASQLRDIRGLDAIPSWPPGVGWWLTAAALLVIIALLLPALRNLHLYPAGTWRRDAWKKLRRLQRQVDQSPPQQVASELSQLLRRIAIASLGREQAASLSGERWLTWLKEHDPKGFDWTSRGKPLLTLPYAPAVRQLGDRRQLLTLINAALAWTDRRNGARRA